MPRVALLSTSDTDLLSARVVARRLRVGQPVPAGRSGRVGGPARRRRPGHRPDPRLCPILAGRAGRGPRDRAADDRARRRADPGRGADARSRRCRSGWPRRRTATWPRAGRGTSAQLHAFLSDTVLLTGEGFDPPAQLPVWGLLDRPADPGGHRTLRGSAILYYRAHQACGNTAFVACAGRCRGGHRRGDAAAVAVPIFSSSLRGAPDDLFAELATLDALIVTVLAAGGTKPATATAGGDDEAWDVDRAGRTGHPDPAGTVPHLRRARPGPTRARACPRWTSPPRSRCRSSTAGSSPCRSPSRRPTRTGCRATSPTPSAAPGSPASPCARQAPAHPAAAPQDRASCCPPTRRSTPGSAMRSAWTPRCRAIRLLRAMRAAGYDLGPER